MSTYAAGPVTGPVSAAAIDPGRPRVTPATYAVRPPPLRPASVEELAEIMRAVVAPVRVRGSGTKLGWLAPPQPAARSAVEVDMRGLGSILEHSPQDLVVRAEAGVRLADLQQLVGQAGQRLALDPPEPEATLGGVIAANASGPRRHRFGTVRDLLLGVTVVLADGTIARSGSKVVKNVAGYDLPKLMTGSFGTLAAVAETIWRLHPLPAAQQVVTAEVADTAELVRLASAIRRAPQTPSAVEVDGSAGAGYRLVLLLEGLEASVQAQAAALATLAAGRLLDAAPDGFGQRPWLGTDSSSRVGVAVAVAPSGIGRALAALPSAALVRGRIATGVLEVTVDAADLDLPRLRAAVAGDDGSVVVRQGPPGLDVWGPVGRGTSSPLELMRRVKDAFDPDGGLEAGRFVGGI